MNQRAFLLLVAVTVLMPWGRPQSLQAQETEAATRQYAVAAGFQNKELFDAAIDEWQLFLKKYPTDPRVDRAQHYLGTCCLQTQRFPEAIAAFTAVITKSPNSEYLERSMMNLGLALYSQAGKLQQKPEFAKAEQAFAAYLKKYPQGEDVGRAQFFRAESLYQLQQMEAAAAEYQAFLKAQPESDYRPDAMYALGTIQQSLKQDAAATATFAEFSSKYPNSKLVTEVRMRQANLLYDGGKYAQAMPLYEQVAANRQFEKADVAMLRQARCLYEQGQRVEAARMYWNIPREFKNTTHYDAAILAGALCYIEDEKYDLARSGLEQVAARNVPQAAEATEWLARSWLKTGNPAKAAEIADAGRRRFTGDQARPEIDFVRIDALREIPAQKAKAAQEYAAFAAAHPQHKLAAESLYLAALTALEVEQFDAARKYGEQFLKQFPSAEQKADVLFVLAESYLVSQQYREAAARYREFLNVGTEHANRPLANVRLATALHLAGEHNEVPGLLATAMDKISDKALRSEALTVMGRSELARGNHAAAVDNLRKAIAENPDQKHDGTLLTLSDALRKQGRAADADAELKQLIQRYPDSALAAEGRYRLGNTDYDAERYQDAMAQYREVVSKWPQSEFAPHARLALAWCSFHLGEFADAVRTINDLQKQDAKRMPPRSFYVRAMADYELSEFDAAIRDADQYLQTKPEKTDRLDALFVKGLAQAGQKKLNEAAATYRSILADSKDYAGGDKAAFELGWTLLDLDQHEQAVAAFGQLARDFPDSPLAGDSLFQVGEAYYQAERFDDAAKAYQTSADKLKDGEVAEKSLHKLGWSQLKADHVPAAAQAFSAQLTRFPNGSLATDARFMLGECHFRTSEWAKAATAYEQMIATGDSDYRALAMFRCGKCASEQEQWADCLQWYRRVLTDYPNFEMRPEAIYGVGWALQNQGQFQQAMEQYTQVTEITDTETAANAEFMLGECCFALKDHQQATRHFLKTVLKYQRPEWSPMAYFEAARCFEVLKDIDQARSCYNDLIQQFPQHAKVPDARRRLEALGKG
ncbi:MAG: tetratricopeptide repeat protein [Planctomycetaceae bacterium]